MEPDPQRHVLGILAGAGEYPRLMVEGAKRAGFRVVIAGFRGAVSKDVLRMADACRCFRVGAVEGPREFFLSEGVTHVALAGQIKPACIYTMWPDATARRLLAGLDRRNAHTIFGAACQYITSNGLEVLPSTAFMESYLPGEGHLAGPAPTADQLEEARHGMELAREIARLDIGQSLIVQGRQVLCVEAYKGTNECIKEGGDRKTPATLCKVTKPGHDMRFDVPCIGLTTIRHCIRHNIRHICFEAGRTILFQRAEVERLCNQHGITLHAMPVPAGGAIVPDPAPAADDTAHAYSLAQALETLGIGHAAVVCEGVVIAVEDSEGPLKCVRRAGAYMKRIRFIRLVNWLCRILLGRRSTPPSPMVMASTRRLSDNADVRRAAARAGIQLADSPQPATPPLMSRTKKALALLLIVLICLIGLSRLAGCALQPAIYPGSAMEIPDASYGHPEQYVTLAAEDGTALRGWFFNRGQGSPLVALYNGNGQNVGEMLPYAAADTTRSYLLINYRGYGDSEGRPRERDMVQDARRNLAWARQQLGGAPASVCLVGFSLGSGVATQVAAAEKPDKLVLICPFDSVESVATGIIPILPRLLALDSWKSVDYAPRIHCPVTILRAAADGIVPPSHTDTLQAAFPSPPQVQSFPAGHNTIFAAPGFTDALYKAIGE